MISDSTGRTGTAFCKLLAFVVGIPVLVFLSTKLLTREISLNYPAVQSAEAPMVLAAWASKRTPVGSCWISPADSKLGSTMRVSIPGKSALLAITTAGNRPTSITVRDAICGAFVKETQIPVANEWVPMKVDAPQFGPQLGQKPVTVQRFTNMVILPPRSTLVINIVLATAVFGLPMLASFVWDRRDPTTHEPPASFNRWWAVSGLVVVSVKAVCAAIMPLVWSGDGVEYGVGALTLVQTGTLGPVNAWRMPGYSFVLSAGLRVADIEAAVSVLHLICGTFTALGAGAIASRVRPHSPFLGPVVMLLVGLDPTALMYERMVLTEAITSAAFVLSMWLVVLAGEQSRWKFACMMIGAAAGVLALASMVRSNMQLFLVLIPFVGVCSRLTRDRWLKSAGTVALSILVAAVILTPRMNSMAAEYGKRTLAIGTGFTRMSGLTDASILELNNADAFTPTEWRHAVDQSKQAWFNGYEVVNCITKSSRLAPRYANLKPWAAIDAGSAELANGTVRRHGPQVLLHSARAFSTLVGIPIQSNPKFREHRWWHQYFSWDPAPPSTFSTWCNAPNEFSHLDQARVQDLAAATQQPTQAWKQSFGARLFGWWFEAAMWIRPIIAAGSLLGMWLLVCRGRWPLALLLALPLVHHAVLAFYLFSGIDRYAAPFYPAMWVAFAAVSCLWRRQEAMGASVREAAAGAERPVK